jgi:hypothetical protein
MMAVSRARALACFGGLALLGCGGAGGARGAGDVLVGSDAAAVPGDSAAPSGNPDDASNSPYRPEPDGPSTADAATSADGAPAGDGGPPAGNPAGTCAPPAEALAEDSSTPRTVVGTGTPESCTGDAFVAAVAKGGVITFRCGDAPATITLTSTAKIVNDTGPKIVIDGGGKITLSGGGKVRILYQNACDEAQVWTSSDCNNQPDPMLTLQNLTFVDGNATGLEMGNNEGGGGAVYVRGGRLKIVNCRFFRNVCDDLGSDVGGGAVRVLDFPTGGSVSRPVYIVGSTFGGQPGSATTARMAAP